MKQITDTILMVRPSRFGFNAETGLTNSFQNRVNNLSNEEIQRKSIDEFDAMVDLIRKVGIEVVVVEDTPTPIKPDAVFPNNWISFHQDGTVITYPMQSNNRRIERREDLIEGLLDKFYISRRYSLEVFEAKQQYLEGTGSMILDHVHKIVYACLSPRTDVRLLEHFSVLFNFKPVYFHSYNEEKVPVYHTNVMMALGVDFAIVCLDSIPIEERSLLIDSLQTTNKKIIPITLDQMNQFAGNMLQLQSRNGEKYLIMSQTAFLSLQKEQISELESLTKLLPISIPIIETIGGGSVRCMIAELFLKKKN
ncbi:MAG: amidinotransferase [Saprospiraceae bacterium]|nr:amidinotransferase [Saprospiraceae bacterium]